MLAVSPQQAEPLETLRAQRRLTFPVLVDTGNRVAEQFGIRSVLPDDLREVYLSFGVDLPQANGDSSWSLPMPARYVTDESGVIHSVAADPDYTVRPEPEETLATLDAISSA